MEGDDDMPGWPSSDFMQTQTLTLPSGARVRARRPSLITMLGSGLPAELTLAVWRALSQDYVPDLTKAEDVRQIALLVHEHCKHTLVEPKLGDVTDLVENKAGLLEGTVRLEDIPDGDRMHLFLFARGLVQSEEEHARQEATAAAVKSFPGDPAGEDAGPRSETVRATAVSLGRDAG